MKVLWIFAIYHQLGFANSVDLCSCNKHVIHNSISVKSVLTIIELDNYNNVYISLGIPSIAELQNFCKEGRGGGSNSNSVTLESVGTFFVM